MSANRAEFLTNENLQGELLVDRLAQGPLAPEEALRIAIHIGTALQHAHAAGKVHGQLSPYAVVMTSSGAKILAAGAAEGMAPGYRAPEQVRGEEADCRSDIFSFGALLYEMASGRPAFSGQGAALDQAILEQIPPAMMAKTPLLAAMEGVIAGCMQKSPVRRRQRIQNAVIELKLVARTAGHARTRRSAPAEQSMAGRLIGPSANARIPAPKPAQPQPDRRPAVAVPRFMEPSLPAPKSVRRRIAIIVLTVLALAATAIAAVLYLHQKPAPAYTFTVTPAEHTTYRMPAVSPDGRYLTISAVGPEGKLMLWLRPLDATHPTPIPGTEGAVAPFWSPDSQYIGFFADKALKKVSINGQQAQKICDVEAMPGGGTWNRDGVILFARGQSDTLYQVPANGGQPQPVLKLNSERFERAHMWPQFLPDGKHFVFFSLTDLDDTSGVYAGTLGSTETRQLFHSETNAVYSRRESGQKGYLLFMRDRSLMAQPFNAAKLQMEGDAVTLAEDIGAVRSLSLAPVSVSDSGILVYQSVGRPSRQMIWMDRAGKQLGIPSEAGEWVAPRISPDGKRAVVAKAGADGVNADLWILQPDAPPVQFTATATHEGSPVWSSDGSRIVYFSNPDGNYDLFIKPLAAGSRAELLLKSPLPKYPTDWSVDGNYLLFGVLSEGSRSDVWGMSMADRRSAPILDTVYSEGYAALSPDGKFLAYQSDETRDYEVYVQVFDGLTSGTKRRWKVSNSLGGLPRWSGDGKELFYITKSGRIMAVPVHQKGDELTFDAPQFLFQTRPIPGTWNYFDVSRDGKLFLVNTPLEWSTATPMTVWTNWTEKLKE